MKFLRLSSLVAFIAISLITIWLLKAKSSQPTPFKGAGGWTLEQSVTKVVAGQEPMLVGKNIEYFHPDGRRRTVQISLKPDGTVGRQSVTTVTPGMGVFVENEKLKVRYFLEPIRPDYKIGGSVDVEMARKDEGYSRDETVLGYLCLAFRSEQLDGVVIESFDAVELGRFPIKKIITTNKHTEVTEPTAIRLGTPPEAALVRNDDWPIDFSVYEKRIAATEELARTNQQYARKASEMRLALEQAKRQLQ
ncbi:MAG: hypothetical protein L0226_07680 [Acidobacteria bacterium]|nr:hypothetical protein [Acidobacteriota bacterium]